MQLGMIGLGRMGANIVRRLMAAGHECVVYDLYAGGRPGSSQPKARPAVDSLAGLRGQARRRRARSGSWCRPRSSTTTLGRARCRCSTPATSSSTAATPTTTTTSAAAPQLAEQGIHYVDVGTSGGVFGLERGYCLMIGGPDDVGRATSTRSSRTLAPGRRRRAAHAGSRPATPSAGRAGLPALRPVGRRSLREDGAQRHRVRADGGVRRRLNILAARERRQADARRRRRDHTAARPRALPVRPRPRRGHRGLAPRQRRRVVAARPRGARAQPVARTSPTSRAACPTPARVGGRSLAAIDDGVPTPVLTAALFERFASRGEADFADRVLSAMRKEFGGHDEKRAVSERS